MTSDLLYEIASDERVNLNARGASAESGDDGSMTNSWFFSRDLDLAYLVLVLLLVAAVVTSLVVNIRRIWGISSELPEGARDSKTMTPSPSPKEQFEFDVLEAGEKTTENEETFEEAEDYEELFKIIMTENLNDTTTETFEGIALHGTNGEWGRDRVARRSKTSHMDSVV